MADPIVIVGGGFAGVGCARRLERLLPRDQNIVLFSRENYLCFTPLLAEVAASSINPQHVVWTTRQMLKRTLCRTAPVTALDVLNRRVAYRLECGDLSYQPYSHLVLTVGSVVNLDVLPGMAAHAFPLKSLGDAFALRNRAIGQLERAECEPDPATRRHMLSFAVVGGGFSGVEVAGELYDLLADSVRFYRSLRREDVRVVIVHGRDHLLPELPPVLGDFALRKMRKRGIEVRLNARAKAVTERGLELTDGEEITAGTVVCTIGNKVHPLLAESGLPMEKDRVRTEPDMRVPGFPEVWAIGDCAAVPNARDGSVSPQLAQFAVRQAKQLAANLARAVRGEPTRPFAYKMKGSFASIGHRNAVGQVFGLNLSGFPAWFLWRGFYLSQMPTFGRKVQIAFDWFWDLFFPRDIVEMSTRPTERLARAHYEPGQFVFHAGGPADKFYIIERGQAGVYPTESEPAVAVLGPGQHFGDWAIVKGGRRSASVKAETALDVLAIPQGAFQDAFRHWSFIRTGLESDRARLETAMEFRRTAAEHPRLTGTPVRDLMTAPVKTVPVGWDYATTLAHCRREGRGSYVVVDDAGRMVGLVTQTDFYNAVRRLLPPTTPLAEVMKKPVLTVKASASAAETMLAFLTHAVKRLVVVADDDECRPVGVVTPFDILPLLAEETPAASIGGRTGAPVASS
jgi:NADH dehydrogenase